MTSRRDVLTSLDDFWAKILAKRARRGRARQRSGVFIVRCAQLAPEGVKTCLSCSPTDKLTLLLPGAFCYWLDLSQDSDQDLDSDSRK